MRLFLVARHGQSLFNVDQVVNGDPALDRGLSEQGIEEAGRLAGQLAALVYGILATVVKPILKLLTLPLAILTLGIAWFFVAMFILWLTDLIVGGLHINGFWTLVGGTIVVWLVGAVADYWIFPKRRVKA